MRKPADHQRENIRADLHKIVNDLIDNWPTIQQQAEDMGAGFPSDTLGSNFGSSELTLVEATAIGTGTDPGLRATTWLANLEAFISQAQTLEDELKKLLPLSNDQKEKLQQRQNTVELCTKCNLPAPKVRRIDGQPYHADTCYYQVWRANRRTDPAPQSA